MSAVPWYGADTILKYGVPPAMSTAAIVERMGKLLHAHAGNDPSTWDALTIGARAGWIGKAAGDLYEACQGPTDPPPAT